MNFALSFETVLPLCIYIGLGVLAGKLGYIDDRTVAQVNRVIYKLLYPLMMFQSLQNAGDAIGGGHFGVLAFQSAGLILQFAILLLLVPLFIKSKPRQGSFIQGAIRSNAILFALPIANTLCGGENTAVVSMAVAVSVTVSNILCVILLEMKRGRKPSAIQIAKDIFTNPLIIGAIAGVIFLLLGWKLPSPLEKAFSTLTSVITPVALIMLGSGLTLKGVRKDLVPLSFVSLIKLVLIPLVMVLIARKLGFRGAELISVFALNCVPTAVASFPMAQQMDADATLAGETVAFTTVLSMVTVFFWISILSGMGLF